MLDRLLQSKTRTNIVAIPRIYNFLLWISLVSLLRCIYKTNSSHFTYYFRLYCSINDRLLQLKIGTNIIAIPRMAKYSCYTKNGYFSTFDFT